MKRRHEEREETKVQQLKGACTREKGSLFSLWSHFFSFCVRVNTHIAHVDVVETRNYTAARQSVRLEEDGDRPCLIADSPAPAAICFICVRRQPCRMALICTYGLYISSTSCHHDSQVREGRDLEGGGGGCSSDVILKQGVSLFRRVDLSGIDAQHQNPRPADISQCRGYKPVQRKSSSSLDLQICIFLDLHNFQKLILSVLQQQMNERIVCVII